jgi:FkbM family methyltransferase
LNVAPSTPFAKTPPRLSPAGALPMLARFFEAAESGVAGEWEAALRARPGMRRLLWRLARRLYCAARGEPARNEIAVNGEAALQRAVVASAPVGPLVVCDVGANHGDWSLALLDVLAAARREDARIFAFEPIPVAQARLSRALARHPLGRLVEMETRGLSSAPGGARFAVMEDDSGTHSLHVGDAAPNGWIDVALTDLASFAKERGIAHFHLVKIDAEGHDAAILRGAAPLLAEGRIDALQFEYNHRWVFARSYLRDVFELVHGLPYAVGRLAPDGVELLPGWHPELERFFEANYCLIRKPALGWFNCRTATFDATNSCA